MVHFPCFVSLPACKWFGSFCWPFLTSWKTLLRNSSGSIGRQQNNSWKWQQAVWAFQIASIFNGVCFFSAPSLISYRIFKKTMSNRSNWLIQTRFSIHHGNMGWISLKNFRADFLDLPPFLPNKKRQRWLAAFIWATSARPILVV